MTVSNKPGHRGEREVMRKTIAQGRPAGSGEPVVTTLVCFVLFRTRGCGCIGHPAFPAPSVYRGANGSCKTSGASRRGLAELYVKFEPRHCEERSDANRHCERSEAIHFAAQRKNGLLRRGACHRARIRATPWLLAMTVSELAV